VSEIAASAEPGVVYEADGRLLDIHQPADAPATTPTVLLWHGRGPDERDVLAPLAREAAALGLTVVVPDWRPDASDGGWGHLLASVRFVRERVGELGSDAERIVLAGWSLGAYAAVSAMLRPDLVDGWRPMAVVGIAGKYVWGRPEMGLRDPREELAAAAVPPIPVHLVHGTADDVVPFHHSREFADLLRHHRWPVSCTETESDHAGVVMTEYDPAQERCLPTRNARVLEAGRAAARVLARAAGLPQRG